MTVDPSKIKAVPIQKTLLLINNFLINTCSFLDTFSNQCEQKLMAVSAKITELETLTSLLESKLNSIPYDDLGITHKSSDLTLVSGSNNNIQTKSTNIAIPPTPPPKRDASSSVDGANTPNDELALACLNTDPSQETAYSSSSSSSSSSSIIINASVDQHTEHPSITSTINNTSGNTSNKDTDTSSTTANTNMIAAKDHPDYLPFFKLIKIGVPPPQIANKMMAAGLNATLLDTPNVLISLSL